jgi:beta-lactamase class A
MLDEIELSVRDLAHLMMTVSDNTATDVLMRMVGVDRINATLAELGLEQTTLVGDCDALLSTFSADTGLDAMPLGGFAAVDPEALRRWRVLDPIKTSRSTAAEMSRLLAMIWRDEAGPAEACAEVRRIMAHQVWPHRLTQGFPDGVTLAAKTGTLPGIRNEAGVASFPDGKRYAVAVFTRSATYVDRQPAVDTAIGRAAFAAVSALRGEASLDDR